MSPPHEESRPGGNATRTAHKSHTKDSGQLTPQPRTLIDLIGAFRGQHNPLRGGWSAEQLRLVAMALGGSKEAVAMVACSLVAEERATGMPLRYSRSQKNYSYFDRYEGDPLMTYRRAVDAADWLIGHGYAEGRTGLWHFGKQSILRATPKLMTLIGGRVDVTARKGPSLKDEILLRDKDGQDIAFCDTDEIRQMRQQMKVINAHLANQRYFFRDIQMYIPPAARIFNQNFRRGGRLYHQGNSYQQMPEHKRGQIELLLDDGTVSPMVELDFESLHMRLIYHQAGKRQPDGDLYAIQGYSRTLAKRATLIAINADGTEIGAIAKELEDDEELALDTGLHHRSPAALRATASQLVAAIRRKHYRVKEFFGTGWGAELMRADSDMAVQIMLTMIEKTGRCPLVVHDSFLVPQCDAGHLKEAMAQALTSTATSNVSSQATPLPLPIHMGKRRTDQQVYSATATSTKTLEKFISVDRPP